MAEVVGIVKIDGNDAEVVRQSGPHLLLRDQRTREMVGSATWEARAQSGKPPKVLIDLAACNIEYELGSKPKLNRQDASATDFEFCERNLEAIIQAAIFDWFSQINAWLHRPTPVQ